MSYAAAKKAFIENRGFVQRPGTDLEKSLAFNLNTGLATLTDAVHSDLSDIEQRLHRIEHLLQQLVQHR